VTGSLYYLLALTIHRAGQRTDLERCDVPWRYGFVGVFVGVLVGLTVGVFVGVLVGLSVGVFVGVFVGILVGVLVGGTGVFVGVLVGAPPVRVKFRVDVPLLLTFTVNDWGL